MLRKWLKRRRDFKREQQESAKRYRMQQFELNVKETIAYLTHDKNQAIDPERLAHIIVRIARRTGMR